MWLCSIILITCVLTIGFQKKSYAEGTNTVSSTVVTNSTPPTANAPSIINSNSDICKVGVGASVQNNVVGVATGVVIDDELTLMSETYNWNMNNSVRRLIAFVLAFLVGLFCYLIMYFFLGYGAGMIAAKHVKFIE